MKILILTISFLLSLSAPVLAESLIYYNNIQRTSASDVTWLQVDSWDEQKPTASEKEVEVSKVYKTSYIGGYDEGYYINPTVTPYYYPDNNQKAHQLKNPFNFIY